jgi:hypothetical protein
MAAFERGRITWNDLRWWKTVGQFLAETRSEALVV